MDERDEGVGSELNTPRMENDEQGAKKDDDASAACTSTPIYSKGVSRLAPFNPAVSPVVEIKNVAPSLASGDAQDSKELALSLSERQATIVRMKQDMLNSNERIKALEKENAGFREEIQKMRTTNEEVIQEIASLKSELELKTASCLHREAELLDARQMTAEVEGKLAAANLKSNEVDALLKQEQAEKTDVMQRYAELQEVAKRQSDELSALKKEAVTVKKEMEDWELEKRKLLQSAADSAKEIVRWREKATESEVLVKEQLKKIEELLPLQSQYVAAEERRSVESAKVSELTARLEDQQTEAKRLRDEVEYLRNKVPALNRSASADSVGLQTGYKDAQDELKRLRAELAVVRRAEAEWVGRKQDLEKQLAEERNQSDLQGKQIVELSGENNNLRREYDALRLECAKFEEEKNFEFENLRKQLQDYYYEQCLAAVGEKDEMIDHLRSQIAALKQQDIGVTSVSLSSLSPANVTVWNAAPRGVRDIIESLAAQYEELNEVVTYMKNANMYQALEAVSSDVKAFEDKATDCDDMRLGTAASSITSQDRSYSPQISDSQQCSIQLEESYLVPERSTVETSKLKTLSNCVRDAELKSKLSPNIRQLLASLLDEILRSDGSVNKISDAVRSFFARLDLALKRTLEQCEQVSRLNKDAEDLRAKLRDNVSLLREKEQLIGEMQSRIQQLDKQIHGLVRSKDGLTLEIQGLQKRIGDMWVAEREAAEHIEELLAQKQRFMEELESANADNEEQCKRIIEAEHEIEELKREKMISNKEVVALEYKLAERNEECSTVRNDLLSSEKRREDMKREIARLKQKAEELEKDDAQAKELAELKAKYVTLGKKFLESEKRIMRYKTKYTERRKVFCDTMEDLAERNEGLVQTNTLRQKKIDLFYKFICRHGTDVVDVIWPLGLNGNSVSNDLTTAEALDQAQLEHLERTLGKENLHLKAPADELDRLSQKLLKSNEAIAAEERNCHADRTVIPRWISQEELESD